MISGADMKRVPIEQRIRDAANAVGLGQALSRRGFLFLSALSVGGVAALGLRDAWGDSPPLVILDNAKGFILADPSRCVGCQRCELACVEYNDGKAQPALARLNVRASLNFGPQGPNGGLASQGLWGNGLVVQNVCRQCPHPVPCATACPNDAIRADPETGARIVDQKICVGCRLCLRACPWDMIVFDEDAGKASKCFLCDGKPKCVEACPAQALHYVPWRDLTRETPGRRATMTVVTPEKAAACLTCHVPGRPSPALK